MKVMEFDENFRSAANIKYDEDVIEAIKLLGFSMSYYDRKEEPEEIKTKEGATIPWGVEVAIKRIGKVPDVIIDKGDFGKEGAIKVFGYNAVDVANKLIKIAKKYREIKSSKSK